MDNGYKNLIALICGFLLFVAAASAWSDDLNCPGGKWALTSYQSYNASSCGVSGSDVCMTASGNTKDSYEYGCYTTCNTPAPPCINSYVVWGQVLYVVWGHMWYGVMWYGVKS